MAYYQPNAIRRGAGVVAFVLLGGVSALAATPVPEQPGLELRLRANSQRIRVWDCLLLKYSIRNNTPAEVVPPYRTEYEYGKVTIELQREPEATWHTHKSILASAMAGASISSFGPGLTIPPGTTLVELSDLFYVYDEQQRHERPVFTAPGVYRLRVCIPFREHGVLRSEPIRVEVADIPADERRFIEQDRGAFTSAIYGSLIRSNDMEGMARIEGRLGNGQNKALLQLHRSILEQMRKSGFGVDDEFRQVFSRLRRERGDIVADFWALNHVTHLYNQRRWRDAQDLLNAVPEHSAQREVLSNMIKNRGR